MEATEGIYAELRHLRPDANPSGITMTSTTSPPQSPTTKPPPYSASCHTTSGFPSGYFVIRSLGAGGRVLDVETSSWQDGTEIILWEEKEVSLVEGLRDGKADNQVFFLDSMGALCSKPSGHAVDVEGGKLVLRHRRPVTHPYPNPYSHPIPQFNYDPSTQQITVTFQHDPTYPPHTLFSSGSTAWRNKSYVLTSVPIRRPRSFVDEAADFISSTASKISAPLSGIVLPFSTGSTQATVGEVQRGEFDLREDEVLEEERAEEENDDDSPEKLRRVRVLILEQDEKTPGPRARERRRWEILPLLKEKARMSRP